MASLEKQQINSEHYYRVCLIAQQVNQRIRRFFLVSVHNMKPTF